MTQKKNPGKKAKQQPDPPANRLVWWVLGFSAIVIAGLLFLLRPAAGPGPGAADTAKLVGRWVRTDGDYMLELRNAQAEGRLEAGYFNPQPINVSRAEWKKGDSGLEVFVELRDVNYPGSTYRLRYLPERDTLVGAYFQATQGQTYEVEFARLNP